MEAGDREGGIQRIEVAKVVKLVGKAATVVEVISIIIKYIREEEKYVLHKIRNIGQGDGIK